MGSSGGVKTKKTTVKHLDTSAMSPFPWTPEALWRALAQASSLELTVALTIRDQ